MRAILLSLALTCQPLATLAETREDRVAVAAEYVDLALADFDMKALIAAMWAPIVQQVQAAGQTVTAEQQAAIDALYTETFAAPMQQLMKDQAGIMADMMTLGEITALRDFYATPDGRSAMAKLPKLAQAQQPGVMKLMDEKSAGLMPKVLEIINGGK